MFKYIMVFIVIIAAVSLDTDVKNINLGHYLGYITEFQGGEKDYSIVIEHNNEIEYITLSKKSDINLINTLKDINNKHILVGLKFKLEEDNITYSNVLEKIKIIGREK